MNEYDLPIYHDPKRYDDEYWWKKDDIEFYKNIIVSFRISIYSVLILLRDKKSTEIFHF